MSSADTCVNELLNLIREDDEGSRAMTNLTLLTDNVKDGAKIVAKLEKKGIKTVHTFPSEISLKSKRPTESRRKKLGFWKGDARVKLTTFHSFC